MVQNPTLPPLGTLTQVIESYGLNVTYAYEDLVFIEHNAFIFQFPKAVGEPILMHFNVDAPDTERDRIWDELSPRLAEAGLEVARGGSYVLEQTEDDQIRLEIKP
jgi:hypothetical protein